MKFKNKYASADGKYLYDSTLLRQERAEGWFRPFATFEKVGLKNGPKVGNVAYGTYMGGESEMYDLGHGWDGMWGAYVGYNGSHQTYDGVGIYQNGGTLGLVGMAYKGNFFTGLTLNAGASGVEASTMYGNEDFSMLMSGIASKTGYNWELFNGKYLTFTVYDDDKEVISRVYPVRAMLVPTQMVKQENQEEQKDEKEEKKDKKDKKKKD